jgi:hypothetical protein
VDGVWYLYPTPIYPYPEYVPDVAEDDSGNPADDSSGQDYSGEPDNSGGDDQSSGNDNSMAPAMAGGPVGLPPAASWYYCDASRTYYPYVQACASGWRQVPAGGSP